MRQIPLEILGVGGGADVDGDGKDRLLRLRLASQTNLATGL